MTLHAMTKGSNVDDIIFPMVDQVSTVSYDTVYLMLSWRDVRPSLIWVHG